jgi:acetylornithine/N-succinyldiaminopimelate aminotransferase
MPTYGRYDIAFERGEGPYLFATDGRRFLDFAAGIAVNALGHSHPKLVKALADQGAKLWHVSNLYRIPEQEKLAEKLTRNTFADKVFFCNSGAEAMEMSVKMARRWQWSKGNPDRYEVITFEGAFHGRTLGMIAATGNAKYLEGFGPKVEGFVQVPLDLAAVERAIGPRTCAILLEPVQGEGGVRVPPRGFLKALRRLCDEHGLLLVLDEIQSGMGRCGRLFAHEIEGVEPDIMAAAKAIGGGFPLGACLATADAAQFMTPGTHGSTYGGNPLATAVGAAVLDIMLEPGFLEGVREKGLRFKQRLAGLKDEFPHIIEEVRGEGLLLGLKLKPPVGEVQKACFGEKLLAIVAGENVLRVLPPLNIGDAEIGEGLDRLSRALGAYSRTMGGASASGNGKAGKPSARAPKAKTKART